MTTQSWLGRITFSGTCFVINVKVIKSYFISDWFECSSCHQRVLQVLRRWRDRPWSWRDLFRFVPFPPGGKVSHHWSELPFSRETSKNELPKQRHPLEWTHTQHGMDFFFLDTTTTTSDPSKAATFSSFFKKKVPQVGINASWQAVGAYHTGTIHYMVETPFN